MIFNDAYIGRLLERQIHGAGTEATAIESPDVGVWQEPGNANPQDWYAHLSWAAYTHEPHSTWCVLRPPLQEPGQLSRPAMQEGLGAALA